MAEEVLDPQAAAAEEGSEAKPRKGKMKMIIIIAAILIVSLASGFAAYTMFIGKKSGQSAHEKSKEEAKVALIALDPMVLNLAEPNRFLKLSIQFELSDPTYQALANERVPQLRDAIIILISSKSFASIMTPEGKFQMKDELLLRANQAVGKDVFKNLYFTEFVTQ